MHMDHAATSRAASPPLCFSIAAAAYMLPFQSWWRPVVSWLFVLCCPCVRSVGSAVALVLRLRRCFHCGALLLGILCLLVCFLSRIAFESAVLRFKVSARLGALPTKAPHPPRRCEKSTVRQHGAAHQHKAQVRGPAPAPFPCAPWASAQAHQPARKKSTEIRCDHMHQAGRRQFTQFLRSSRLKGQLRSFYVILQIHKLFLLLITVLS